MFVLVTDAPWWRGGARCAVLRLMYLRASRMVILPLYACRMNKICRRGSKQSRSAASSSSASTRGSSVDPSNQSRCSGCPSHRRHRWRVEYRCVCTYAALILSPDTSSEKENGFVYRVPYSRPSLVRYTRKLTIKYPLRLRIIFVHARRKTIKIDPENPFPYDIQYE